MVKKPIQSNDNGKGEVKRKIDRTRKSKSDKELWERIGQEVRAWAKCEGISDIAARFGISAQQVYEDLKKYHIVEEAKETAGINKEILTLKQVIVKAFEAMEGYSARESKSEMMKVVISAVKEISILRGSREVEGSSKTFIGGSLDDLLKKHNEAKC